MIASLLRKLKRDLEMSDDKIKNLIGEMEDMTMYVDMVMVIDATQDSPFVSNNYFWQDLFAQIENLFNCVTVNRRDNIICRIKIMYFRDFYFDGKYAFGESPFFDISKDKDKSLEYIKTLKAAGGGDIPESGLEALWLAMNADYIEHYRYRKIITLFTNATAHPLEDYEYMLHEGKKQNCCAPVNYPGQIPHCIGDFYNSWETWCGGEVGHLCIVAPQEYPWPDMEVELPCVQLFDVAQFDCNKLSYNAVKDAIESLIYGYGIACFAS